MSLRLENGVIVVTGPNGDLFPTAEEIYSTVFESRTSLRGALVDAQAFRNLGLGYSQSPATPVIVISAEVSDVGEPRICCKLAGKVGATIAATPIDYVVVDQVWYPLPQATGDEFATLLSSSGIADAGAISFGQYLELQKRATSFLVDDAAASHLAAAALSARFPSQPPTGLAATPYHYQQVGMQWLGFMSRHGVGSILADEMGLGKTLQVIAVFLAEIQAQRRPNLVLCPATLLENWRRELQRFAPTLTVRTHSGPNRTGSAGELAFADVTLASYETMASDISIFRAVMWNVVALDEAQSIKNPDTRRTKRAKELRKRVGIAITGTPVENHLRDLWSLCDFVLPGHLGEQGDFEKRFPDTIDGAKEVEPLVSAIMLRRLVRDVATDLPERIDIPVALVMDAQSADAYEEIRREAAANATQAPDLAALIYLRMFCSHPWAVGKLKDVPTAVACSPKLARCFEILEEIFAAKAKAIIFCSFNDTAALLESEIAQTFGVSTWKINGSVAVFERQKIVDEFSASKNGAVLVLNPKAAGVGLNITAANHVIHYNLEWNPAVEDQASARAYRRGQTRPVTVHRLFYADTVEEAINDRMIRKRALAGHAVIGSAGGADDLIDILNALKRSPKSII